MTQDAPRADVTLLQVGELLPDLELPDHAGHMRALSELVGGDPLRGALLEHETRAQQRGRHDAEHVFHVAPLYLIG